MRIKPKTTGQKIADTIITQVDKLENDDLIKISEYVPPPARTEIPPPHGTYTTGDCTLSIQNILNICREDEQNQLAEMLGLQEEANFNNEQFNKSNMK